MKKKVKKMLQPAKKIELDRYLGKWHEIASFPFIFQRGCSGTTAEYSLKGNGDVKVFNSCDVKGKKKNATGSAKLSKKENVLRVGFPPFEFLRADYIILFLEENYKYVVVGSSGKNYLWILAREKNIDNDVYEFLVDVARKEGYDVNRLVRTKQ